MAALIGNSSIVLSLTTQIQCKLDSEITVPHTLGIRGYFSRIGYYIGYYN